MKILIAALLLLTMFFSSCASQEKVSVEPGTETTITPEAEMLEMPSREAVFVYGSTKDLPRIVTLKLAGEPFLFPSGYVRLAGVVSGGKPVALIEIGGRGLALEKGDKINDYRIAGITSDNVLLKKGD
ncbi:MAG: hypothetical protein PHH60_03555 [Candidatus Margulisbacteria bacterium]|nr:hypothetical protein [Candidatus Margulisiibacteriota bacterium]